MIELEGTTYDGEVIRDGNKFYFNIRVNKTSGFNKEIIDLAHSYTESLGEITLVNCRIIPSIQDDKSRLINYKFSAERVIRGNVDPKELQIDSLQIYFKEFDNYFVKNQTGYVLPLKPGETWKIEQQLEYDCLYKDHNICINHYNIPSIEFKPSGEKILINTNKVEVQFANNISFTEIDGNIKKIESIFGFLLKRKMHLINLSISNDGTIYEVIKSNMSKYGDTEWKSSNVTDIPTCDFLMRVINTYYNNSIIAACINTYNEYLSNELDMIFEFTSLINTLEMITNVDTLKNKVIPYALETNEELLHNNSIMESIHEKIDELLTREEQSFLRKIYNNKYVSLGDKIRYIFFKENNLIDCPQSRCHIQKIIKTRNYFVHGGNNDNILEGVELFLTKELIGCMLYNIIFQYCCGEDNAITKVNSLIISNYEDWILKPNYGYENDK